jgi:hypothetical protein
MKTCRECGIKKPLSEYYAHSEMADGYLNKCKICVKIRVSKHREINLDRIKEYDRKRGMNPERVKARKEYQKTDAGKIAKKRALNSYKIKHSERHYARNAINNALRDGRIEKMPCLICGDEKVEGHHPDYSRPLDVVWLCNKHHRETHNLTRKNHGKRPSGINC